MQRLLIIGGGFAGLTVARRLQSIAEVTVIDARPVHTYTPWLYLVASRSGAGKGADTPFAGVRGAKSVRFVHDVVTDIRGTERVVLTASGKSFRYDVLVIAVGSVPNDFGIPGVKEHALMLKTSADAVRIADALRGLEERSVGQDHLVPTIALIGAGPTGVETAAEIAVKARDEGKRLRVVLLDGATKPLGKAASPKLANFVLQRLTDVGVEWLGEAKVTAVQKGAVTYEKKAEQAHVGADVVVWSGGVAANPAVQAWHLPLDAKGRILVEANFSVQGREGVYALGDIALVHNPKTGSPDPQSAQVALRQAKHLSNELHRWFTRQLRPRSFSFPRAWHLVVAVGGKYAVASVYGVALHGRFAYLLRYFVDWRYMRTIR